MERDLSKYVGRKYEDCNCFDLVKEFYLDQFGIDIKHYYEADIPEDKKEQQNLIISNKGHFQEVKERYEYGDIAVIRLYGYECHLGIIVSGTKFLHTIKQSGSIVDRLERYSKLIAGVYRHKAVA